MKKKLSSIVFSDPSKKFIGLRFEILNPIFIAIQNVGKNAKALIGNELISKLGDISYDPIYSLKKENDQYTKDFYDSANEILKFKESLTVYWKY